MKKTNVILTCVMLLGFHVFVVEAGKIHDAAREGELWKIEEIIKNDPKQINVKDDGFSSTPLHLASQGGYKDIVKLLIDKGADVNTKDKDGRTPLHVAAELGYSEVTELLIEAGSEINAEDNDFNTPLHLACQSGNKEIVKLLIDNGAEVDMKDKNCMTPLDYAIAYGHNEIANFLSCPSQKSMEYKCTLKKYWRSPEEYIWPLEKYWASQEYARGLKDEEYEKVQIFYGTDREKTGEEKPNNYYGSHQADSIEYGTCEVSIPKKHATGEIERPGIWGMFKEDPTKHVVLLSIEPMQDSNFFSALREKINKSTEKDAFIFVHGYCVTFADAARRTAQLAYDLGFNGAPVLYSWPSNEEYKRYDGDLEKVRYAVKNFERFLNQIVSNTQAQNIHLIAHSMGNVALTEALKSIGQRTKKPLFNQVILAAPDIDARIFKQDIVPAIGTAKRITLYASSADHALSLSRKFLKNPEILRAGESGDGMVVLDGIDTVDASQINTGLLGLGHSYFAETMSLINDIFHLLRNDLSPDKRNLRPREKDLVRYWSFPKTR